MATIVRAVCSKESGGDGCGEIKTTHDKVVLILPEGGNSGEPQYRFICPQCNKIVLKEATEVIVQLLHSAGVPIEHLEPPLEILERPSKEDAEPITSNDIIDLHFQLENDQEEWLRRMENRG